MGSMGERQDSERRTVSDVVLLYDDTAVHLPMLRSRFPQVRFHPVDRYSELAGVLDQTAPQVVWATHFSKEPFPRQPIVDCRSLEWLSIGFAGVDRVAPWNDERLVVTNASGVASKEMAQYVLAAIFGMHQRFPQFARQQHDRKWHYRTVLSAREATIGLVGLGHTGEAIASLCRAVGMRVVACRATGEPSPHVDRVYAASNLHEMLGAVDVAVVCCAATATTRNLMNEEAFAAMRPGSFFVNVARGVIVDEEALVRALAGGHLEAAVIDVTRTEPLPSDSPLWETPNLMITPHTSSEFAGWRGKALEMFADNLEKWLHRLPLANRVFSQRGY